MAAHGASVVEIALVDGKWRPVHRQPPQPAHHGHDRDDRRRPGRRPRPAQDQGRSHAGARSSAPSTTAPAARRPGAPISPPRRTSTATSGPTSRAEDSKRRLTTGLGGAQQKSYDRYGVPGNWYSWGKFHDRFNVDKEANEPNRFGWIVEIDPSDPASTPVKHTALGRFRHEGAETIVNKDGRVVVYSGDDARFDYVYRFVSRDRDRGPATRRTTCASCRRARCRSPASTTTARRPGCRWCSARGR